ncbi:hypothetical protein [Dickeya zeae]|nr:hypothetical protein [Dickeya zeae]AUQ25575.1 hypothetical protein C1O30_11025 [Dickeya zeae]UJR58648.1 hypothetical protein HJ580_10910 [Dickeya zeae]
MPISRIPDTESTLRATSSVLGLLSQIAGFTVGFTGLAYIIGWRETSAYYFQLGAPWATSLLTPAQVMQTSISLITIISTFAFISVVSLITKDVSTKGLRRWSIFSLTLALVAYGLSLVLEKHVSAFATNTLVGVSGLLWAVAAGTTVGELIACLALRELQWGGYEVYLLNFIVLYGFSQAPSLMGESKARLVGDTVSTSLPSISLAGTVSGSWRLVGPCGDKFLLISLASERQGRSFKLVNSEDIEEIRASGSITN